jgi:hypothetical protein
METFKARLESDHEGGAWAGIRAPFDAEEVFGSKGRISVTGLINNVPYESSIFPMGDGTHFRHINKAQQKEAGVKVGDLVTVTMEAAVDGKELEKRTRAFKKEYISWIESAKRPETRQRRIEQAVVKISAGQRMYD